MFEPTLIERIKHKIDTETQGIRSHALRKQLNNEDFSIISNNCWGGVTYEHYGIKKMSPTIGAYIFADDYLELIANLKYYLARKLNLITVKESRHKNEIIENGTPNVIVGKLVHEDGIKSVEIVFLHYKDPKVIMEKWERRKQRMNYDNLIFKFSYQNGCTEEHIKKFDEMNLPGKKFVFVNKPEDVKKYSCAVYYPGFENNDQVENDTFYWNKYFDVTAFLNGEGIKRF